MVHHPTHVTLFKRGPVWYLDYWLEGKRIKESTGCELKSEAELLREDLQKKLVLGKLKHLKDRDVPVYRCYREYLRFGIANYKTKKTQTTDRCVLKKFFRWAGLPCCGAGRTSRQPNRQARTGQESVSHTTHCPVIRHMGMTVS